MKKKRMPLGEIVEKIREREPEILTLADVGDKYTAEVIKCINLTAEAAHKKYDQDFIIDIRLSRDVLHPEKITIRGFARISLPYPTFDQLTFIYKKNSDTLLPLWQLPCRSACDILPSGGYVTPNEEKLIPQIIAFKTGELHKAADDYNRKIDWKEYK